MTGALTPAQRQHGTKMDVEQGDGTQAYEVYFLCKLVLFH